MDHFSLEEYKPVRFCRFQSISWWYKIILKSMIVMIFILIFCFYYSFGEGRRTNVYRWSLGGRLSTRKKNCQIWWIWCLWDGEAQGHIIPISQANSSRFTRDNGQVYQGVIPRTGWKYQKDINNNMLSFLQNVLEMF